MASGDERDPEITTNSPSQIGPYRVVRKLGQGGMGEVFLCRDTRVPGAPDVAVKTIFSDLLQDPEIAKRFDTEVKLLGAVSHQAVVRLIEDGTFESNGRRSRYMAMERIDGVSLYTLCHQRRLSIPDTLNIALQLANGLNAIHSAGVLHRDLKPGNILITKEGTAKIIDFGIAKPSCMGQLGADDVTRGFKTQTGIVIGTVNYLAPEVLRDQPASTASDVYALGLIIWEMLCGKVPFKTGNLAETINLVMTRPLSIPVNLRSLLPPGLSELIGKMAAKEVSVRPLSAAAVAAELMKIETGDLLPSLLRKTRFDLAIQWSAQTFEQIKRLDIDDSEAAFVLQEIEDQLVGQFDPRIHSTTPIDVSQSLIEKCVALYRRTRFESVTARRDAALAGGGVVEISPIDRMTISEKKAPHPLSRTSGILFVMLATACLLYVVILKYPDKMQRLGNSVNSFVREFIGSSETTAASSMASQGKQKEILFVGRKLVYRISRQVVENSLLASEETRVIESFSDSEAVWKVDGRDVVRTPRTYLPLEAYFHPVHRKRTEPYLDPLPAGLFPLTVGHPSYAQISDDSTNSTERIKCTPISSRKTTIENVEQNLWRIECTRDVFRKNLATNKVLETYYYAPELEAVIYAELKTSTLNANGETIEANVFRFDLQPGRSKLKPN